VLESTKLPTEWGWRSENDCFSSEGWGLIFVIFGLYLIGDTTKGFFYD
jgi:hypothetical protein